MAEHDLSFFNMTLMPSDRTLRGETLDALEA